jgi:sec-independent protein translocase protein TatB
MFGIDSAELLVIAVVALVIIGPKDLPKVMRTVGQWVSRARGMASHFRAGMDTMIRESELEEMHLKWSQENDRIMRQHPMPPPSDHQPLPSPPQEGAGATPKRKPPPAPPMGQAAAPARQAPRPAPSAVAPPGAPRRELP